MRKSGFAAALAELYNVLMIGYMMSEINEYYQLHYRYLPEMGKPDSKRKRARLEQHLKIIHEIWGVAHKRVYLLSPEARSILRDLDRRHVFIGKTNVIVDQFDRHHMAYQEFVKYFGHNAVFEVVSAVFHLHRTARRYLIPPPLKELERIHDKAQQFQHMKLVIRMGKSEYVEGSELSEIVGRVTILATALHEYTGGDRIHLKIINIESGSDVHVYIGLATKVAGQKVTYWAGKFALLLLSVQRGFRQLDSEMTIASQVLGYLIERDEKPGKLSKSNAELKKLRYSHPEIVAAIEKEYSDTRSATSYSHVGIESLDENMIVTTVKSITEPPNYADTGKTVQNAIPGVDTYDGRGLLLLAHLTLLLQHFYIETNLSYLTMVGAYDQSPEIRSILPFSSSPSGNWERFVAQVAEQQATVQSEQGSEIFEDKLPEFQEESLEEEPTDETTEPTQESAEPTEQATRGTQDWHYSKGLIDPSSGGSSVGEVHQSEKKEQKSSQEEQKKLKYTFPANDREIYKIILENAKKEYEKEFPPAPGLRYEVHTVTKKSKKKKNRPPKNHRRR